MDTTHLDLYPATTPRRSGYLDRPGGHAIYWEECGAPGGVPVVFLHGGPGAGISPGSRRLFDPFKYRVILFDQRGCGKSTPHGSVQDNTTQHLVGDIEALRAEMGIDQWVVFGGSWGSTLALAYGQAHPDRCLGFILRGVFLHSDGELDWFLTGMGKFRPAAGRRFFDTLGLAPDAPWREVLHRYHAALFGRDRTEQLAAARAWAGYELAACTLRPDPAMLAHGEEGAAALALARLEAHYFIHDGFLSPGQLLSGAAKLAHLPCTIVQGLHDLVTPPETAERLHRAWPGSQYVPVADGGHSASDPAIARALVAATDRFDPTPGSTA